MQVRKSEEGTDNYLAIRNAVTDLLDLRCDLCAGGWSRLLLRAKANAGWTPAPSGSCKSCCAVPNVSLQYSEKHEQSRFLMHISKGGVNV